MTSKWYEIRIYQDTWAEWRWRIVAPNGRIVADSAEGYPSRQNVKRAVNRLREATGMLFVTVKDV